jgi:RHS repeat-associated protein
MPGRYEKGSPPTEEDFTGHVKDDATGLHYAGARYYSSAFARWTTTDPILGQKGPKKLLKQDARLLTMTSYIYAFGNPVTLTDPTGLAPTDWYRDEDGEIKYDEDVQSQADLEGGQTYLGENVLQYQEDGPTRLGTEGGDWVNVFDESTTRAEAGAIGASKTSISATPVSSLLSAESVSGGKALSGLKTGTRSLDKVCLGWCGLVDFF